MTFKKIIRYMHLWLGLSSGLVVFMIAITGCLYAFQAEIGDLTQRYRFVEEQHKPFLPPSVLRPIAEKELPGMHAHSVQYLGSDHAACITFYHDDPAYYYIVYINPYDGRVLQTKNMDRDFFRVVLMGHFYLWLPPTVGQPIVAIATLIFLVMLISGLILWWPKNKSARKQRFRIKWDARWRRKNYDLHNVLGFYMTWIVIFIVITGLVWGFPWFAKGYYALSGGNKTVDYSEPVSTPVRPSILNRKDPVDMIYFLLQKEQPMAEGLEVHFPETAEAPIAGNTNPDIATYWKTDYRYFDQYSLKELAVPHVYGAYKDADASDKLMRMNYDIHVGAILGLPGKILAFFASLIAASLPVTGFLIWWGRRKKQKA